MQLKTSKKEFRMKRVKENENLQICFFPPRVLIWDRLAKILILILRRDHQKISYERCDYESVDGKSILGYVPKNDEKRIQAVMG